MKTSKKCKLIVGAFLAGELVSVLYKDEKLKKKLQKQTDIVDKAKSILNSLVDLNKELFMEVKDYDYETKYQEVKQFVDQEKIKVEKEISKLQNQAQELNDEQIKPLLKDIESRIESMNYKIRGVVNDTKDTYNLDSKVQSLKKNFLDIKKDLLD